MKPIVISSSVYEKDETQVFSRIEKILDHADDNKSCLLINDAAINDENIQLQLTAKIIRIPVSEWLDDSINILKNELRMSAAKLDHNKIIMLDVRYHDLDVIEKILNEVSLTWFNLETWQDAFILLVDDHHSLKCARLLAETFYLRALPANNAIIDANLNVLRKKIYFFRWLGMGRLSRITYSLFIFLKKLKAYVQRKFFIIQN